MNYNSKIYIIGIIIGAFVGWLLTGSILAIFLISLLWHFLFRNSDQIISDDVDSHDEELSNSQANPLKCVINIIISMLSIKGNILKDDLARIEEYFISSKNFDYYELKALKLLIFQTINNYENINMEKSTQIINRYYGYEEKLSIIELLFSLLENKISINPSYFPNIPQDNQYKETQLNYIFNIAQKLQIMSSDYNKIKSQFTKEDLSLYYKILNLPVNATLEEVKIKYRELAMQLHPDKNQTSNNSEEFQKISTAYKEILKKR